MNIIEVENVSHRFADQTIGIDGVSFAVQAGACVVIAGPNGSGKTTLLRHLNGLLRPTAGTVKVAGVAIEKDVMRARQLVGMMFQDADSQIIGETVYEDVAFGPENLCLDRAEIGQRVAQALRAVDLEGCAHRRPHLLSGGEKRRLAIAGILAMDPAVIIFDEPFASLDYPGVQQVLRNILALHRSGRTIIIATHDLEKVIAHADRLILLNNGKIVRDGSPPRILRDVEIYGIRQPCATRLGMEVRSWLS